MLAVTARRLIPLVFTLAAASSVGCAWLEDGHRARLDRERAAAERAEAAAAQHRATLERNLQLWVGRPARELVVQWTPTVSTTFPDRTMVLEYNYVDGQRLGPSERSRERVQWAAERGGSYCALRFVVSADGRIASWTWRAGAGATDCPIE